MQNPSLPISLFLRKDYLPHFLDLSGQNVFDFYLDIKRWRNDTDPRDLTLLTNNSVFDIPYAFQEGLFELVDEETGAVVLWPLLDGRGPEPKEKAWKFITLPLKSGGPDKKNRIRSIHFNAMDLLKDVVLPGRQYRIRLRDLDCHVKWWSYSLPPPAGSGLPISEPGKLVAQSTTNRLFRAVSCIRSPPTIAITMSLSPPIVSYDGPLPTLRATVTNMGSHLITIKSSGEQTFTSTHDPNPRDPLIIDPLWVLGLRNFTITSADGSVLVDIPGCPCGGSYGVLKKNFTTLEPGVPLVMEKAFWEYEWLRKKLGDDRGGVFRLGLKKREAWWHLGTIEDLFRGRERVEWKELVASACLPVVLESVDEVEFTFVG